MTAAGMRVHTRVYDDDAVWVYDPDWKPTSEERTAEEHAAWFKATHLLTRANPSFRNGLRAVD